MPSRTAYRTPPSKLFAVKKLIFSRTGLRPQTTPGPAPSLAAQDHYLFLLSDSALPLGSFAFSSGLESYLLHHRLASSPTRPSLSTFLPLSISSYASTSLPFVLAAHRDPSLLGYLDDALDASIVCAVGRRASTAQGRALLGIWERAFGAAVRGGSASEPPGGVNGDYLAALDAFGTELRRSNRSAAVAGAGAGGGGGGRDSASGKENNADSDDVGVLPEVSGHLAPLMGVVAGAMGLSLEQTAHVFLLGHAKALVSAAVRASVFGPYQAQKVLAGAELRRCIDDVMKREWNTEPEMAGQSVPVMDLWIGRHELLYSRIFNS